MAALSDEALAENALQAVGLGETLDALLPEAFAVREVLSASCLRHFDAPLAAWYCRRRQHCRNADGRRKH